MSSESAARSSRSEKLSGKRDFVYPPAVNDILWKEKELHSSQRSKATMSTDRSSMRSSMMSSMHSNDNAPCDLLPSRGLVPSGVYAEDEDDYLDEDRKEAKDKNMKKKDEKRWSHDRHSSRQTVETSERHRERHERRKEEDGTVETRERRRERKERKERTGDGDGTLENRERRRERKERKEQKGEYDRSVETRERRKERKERKERRGEDDRTVDTLERRKERKERKERRREEEGTKSCRTERSRHRHHSDTSHHRSSVDHRHSGSTHRHSSSSGHLESSRAPKEIYVEGLGYADSRPRMSHHHDRIPEEGARIPEEGARAAAIAPRLLTPVRKRPDMDVPMNIMVVPASPTSDLEPDIPDTRERKARLKSDYDRLMDLLQEQNEIMDRHKRSEADEPSPASNMVDRLPSSMHPLIAASDSEFQQAFDALARDAVFDDNFEQAFNEFSEHYLALSPWGEDDSMENKDKKPKSSEKEHDRDEHDFIQIPITPVSRKAFKKRNHPKEDVHEYDERPRTPTLEKGVLNSTKMGDKDDLKDNRHGDEFLEVSRTPFYRRRNSTDEDRKDDKEKDEPHGNDFVYLPRKPYSSQGNSRHGDGVAASNEQVPSGELKSSWARLHETPENPAPETSSKDTANDQGRRKWKLLRGKRGTSKSTL